jgi:hypothetical protein
MLLEPFDLDGGGGSGMKDGACRMLLRGVLINATRKVDLVDTSIGTVYIGRQWQRESRPLFVCLGTAVTFQCLRSQVTTKTILLLANTPSNLESRVHRRLLLTL